MQYIFFAGGIIYLAPDMGLAPERDLRILLNIRQHGAFGKSIWKKAIALNRPLRPSKLIFQFIEPTDRTANGAIADKPVAQVTELQSEPLCARGLHSTFTQAERTTSLTMSLPNKQNVLNAFLSGFSIADRSGAFHEDPSIAEMTSATFKVSTGQEGWLVKLVDKNAEQIEKENTLLTALHTKASALLIPYCRTKNGNSYLALPGDASNNLKLVATPFIENSPTFTWTTPTWTIAHSVSAGSSLQAFHNASADCLKEGTISKASYERVPTEKMRSALLNQIDRAGKTQTNLFGTGLPPYESLRAMILRQSFNEVENLPASVILHGDYHPGNLLYDGSKVQSIVDLDAEFSFVGNPLFDLAYALIAFSAHWQGGRFSENSGIADYLAMNHFKSLLRGYQWHEREDEALSMPLNQALSYSCMLFLLWALDAKRADPELSRRILFNASGLLTALGEERS